MTAESEPSPLDLRLLPAAVISWAATLSGILLGWQAALWLGVALIVCAATVAGLGRKWQLAHRARAASLAMLLLGAGFAMAVCWRAHAVQAHPLARVDAGAHVAATIVVSEDPRSVAIPGGGRQLIVTATLERIRLAAGTSDVGGAVVVLAPVDGWDTLLPGQRVELRGTVRPPRHLDLTVATIRASGPPVRTEPPSAVQRMAGSVRQRFAEAASAALPGDPGALLPGLVVGDTSRLSDEVRNQFKVAGLSHLTAVSGANVSIVIGAVLLSVRGLTLGPRTGVVVAALALALFVIVARPSPSVLRAAAMGSIGLLALITARRKQAMPALGGAIIGLIALYPALAVDFGFALSVVATAGLILLAPTWADWLRARGWPRAPAEMLAVAAAAFAVTTPIVAGMSGAVSLVSIGANLLVAVVVAPVTVLGAMSAVLASIWLPAAVLVARLAELPLRWLLWIADRASSIPGASITVPDGPPGALVSAAGVAAIVVVVRIAVGRRG